jgi:hypothetical protein
MNRPATISAAALNTAMDRIGRSRHVAARIDRVRIRGHQRIGIRIRISGGLTRVINGRNRRVVAVISRRRWRIVARISVVIRRRNTRSRRRHICARLNTALQTFNFVQQQLFGGCRCALGGWRHSVVLFYHPFNIFRLGRVIGQDVGDDGSALLVSPLIDVAAGACAQQERQCRKHRPSNGLYRTLTPQCFHRNPSLIAPILPSPLDASCYPPALLAIEEFSACLRRVVAVRAAAI